MVTYVDGVRIRFPELLQERQLTPYGLSKASDGRVSMSTAYRLARLRGRVQTFDGKLLETLCDVLDVEPGDLLEREKPKRRAR